ncbi:MAG: 1-acyl-sn-glycerol-3-phosphate acyltransferase [Cyanobacteria bacterium Co-bin8]|nr:1-acyl-sn-glycerol-3-phosphate acyltransferase [Cyanobacteria bacterium Co-bin8]
MVSLFPLTMPTLQLPTKKVALTQTKPTTSRCSPLLTPLAYFLGQRLVLPFYFGKISVSGQENLPTSGPVILAPTHRARWDSLVLPMVTGRPATGRDLRFMVTADEVKGLQGWFIRRLGGFAVNVRRPTISSLRHGIDLLLGEAMLVIFPEGGIFRDNRVHRLKPGLARLAVQAEAINPKLDVQIVPISLHYDTPFPTWRSNVQIVIGRPIPVANYVGDNPNADTLKANAKLLTADLQKALIILSEDPQHPSTDA